jgi:hypothetical protein
VSADLAAVWGLGDAQSFQKNLEEAGYTLARGDRRLFVVIDRAGNAHSLARRVGMRCRDVNAKLRGLDLDALPSVAATRDAIDRRANLTSLHSRYRAAATEMAAPAAPRVLPVVARRRAPNVAAAIGWINLPEHLPGAIMRHATAPRAA